jgi:hypothetical protein
MKGLYAGHVPVHKNFLLRFRMYTGVEPQRFLDVGTGGSPRKMMRETRQGQTASNPQGAAGCISAYRASSVCTAPPVVSWRTAASGRPTDDRIFPFRSTVAHQRPAIGYNNVKASSLQREPTALFRNIL